MAAAPLRWLLVAGLCIACSSSPARRLTAHCKQLSPFVQTNGTLGISGAKNVAAALQWYANLSSKLQVPDLKVNTMYNAAYQQYCKVGKSAADVESAVLKVRQQQQQQQQQQPWQQQQQLWPQRQQDFQQEPWGAPPALPAASAGAQLSAHALEPVQLQQQLLLQQMGGAVDPISSVMHPFLQQNPSLAASMAAPGALIPNGGGGGAPGSGQNAAAFMAMVQFMAMSAAPKIADMVAQRLHAGGAAAREAAVPVPLAGSSVASSAPGGGAAAGGEPVSEPPEPPARRPVPKLSAHRSLEALIRWYEKPEVPGGLKPSDHGALDDWWCVGLGALEEPVAMCAVQQRVRQRRFGWSLVCMASALVWTAERYSALCTTHVND